MNTCGFICFPASNPGDGSASYDCAHDEKQHYDIDGENVGCTACERFAENNPPDSQVFGYAERWSPRP